MYINKCERWDERIAVLMIRAWPDILKGVKREDFELVQSEIRTAVVEDKLLVAKFQKHRALKKIRIPLIMPDIGKYA
jgi:hypothetical protein